MKIFFFNQILTSNVTILITYVSMKFIFEIYFLCRTKEKNYCISKNTYHEAR